VGEHGEDGFGPLGAVALVQADGGAGIERERAAMKDKTA
jgi:hypothetical protein